MFGHIKMVNHGTLEEKYPAYGNLVPRDIATREIFDVCVEQKLGINGENMVYLDLSHKDPKELDIKLGGIIEIYEKFTGMILVNYR